MNESASRAAAPTGAALSHADIRIIIGGVMLAMFLAALDQTIIAAALPTIGRAFGNVEDLPWLATSYLLAATAVTPLYGKFSDIHGRRITLLVGISTFVLGSVACALAPTMLWLIVARAVQGLGGGGLIALAQTVIADVAAPRERGRYQAYFASVFAGSSLAGPVLGGFFAEHLHWSLIFWINVPLGLLAFFLSFTTLKRLPRHERKHRLDILGAALIVAASVSLMLALAWGGVRFPWSSGKIVGLLAASLVLSALFAARVARAEEPLIPRTVLGNSIVNFGTASSSFALGTMIALTVFTPIYFEVVAGLSAAQSGLALLPLTLGTVCGATASGRAMTRVNHYRLAAVLGLAVAALACAALALVGSDAPFLLVIGLLAAASVGMGTQFPVTTVAVQNAVAPREMGAATATIAFFRQLGGALMVAAFGAILLNGAAGGARLAPEMLAPAAVQSAFRWLFLASAAGFAAAVALLLCMEERPLRGSVAPPEGR
jgi:EmrB/QacA subfamily drug resistance transporter